MKAERSSGFFGLSFFHLGRLQIFRAHVCRSREQSRSERLPFAQNLFPLLIGLVP
jgi:hypothetical protein